MLSRSRSHVLFCSSSSTSKFPTTPVASGDTRKGGFQSKLINHHHSDRPRNQFNKNNHQQRQHADIDKVLSQLNHGNHNLNKNNSNSSSLISRLKDNLLQQRWANSLSLFDNTSDEVKKSKWRNFHYSAILEVNRKHNRSAVSRHEQFEKVWTFLHRQMNQNPNEEATKSPSPTTNETSTNLEFREQTADGHTISEALAIACQLHDKTLVNQVKEEIELRMKLKQQKDDGDLAPNNNKINHIIMDASFDVLRPFAKRFYERYVTSDWETALRSTESFLESVGATTSQNAISESTMMNADAEEDDETEISQGRMEEKLAELEKQLQNQNMKQSSSSTARNVPVDSVAAKSRILENIHNLLGSCENPETVKSTIEFMKNNTMRSETGDFVPHYSQKLPALTEQTLSCLIQCYGRRGEWELALQCLSPNTGKNPPSSSEIKPGPFCYAQALKAVVTAARRNNNISKRNNNDIELGGNEMQRHQDDENKNYESKFSLFLLDTVAQNLVNEMSDSQIPHTPVVVEALVSVFDARAHFSYIQQQQQQQKDDVANNRSTDNMKKWKSTAWLEALSYFTAIRLSTNLKGTRNTYETLMRMHEKKHSAAGGSASEAVAMTSSEKTAHAKVLENIYGAMKEDGIQPDAKSNVKLINSWSFQKARDLRGKF